MCLKRRRQAENSAMNPGGCAKSANFGAGLTAKRKHTSCCVPLSHQLPEGDVLLASLAAAMWMLSPPPVLQIICVEHRTGTAACHGMAHITVLLKQRKGLCCHLHNQTGRTSSDSFGCCSAMHIPSSPYLRGKILILILNTNTNYYY